MISPLLANLYLHYVLDLWAERWRRREAAGNTIIVRYADDLIVGFEHETDARRFLDEMRNRLQEFALSLHSEKTRLIEFGRFAAESRKRRGVGKPETFTFLELHFYLQQKSAGASSKSNGRLGGIECGQSCKPSNRNCDEACISRFPSREDGCSRSSPATSTTTRCRPTVRHCPRSYPTLPISGGERSSGGAKKMG